MLHTCFREIMYICFFMNFETLMDILCLKNISKLNYNRVMKRSVPKWCNKSNKANYSCLYVYKDINWSMQTLISNLLFWEVSLNLCRRQKKWCCKAVHCRRQHWTTEQTMERCSGRAGTVIALFIAFIQCSMVHCLFSIFHEIFICYNVSPENSLLYSNSKNNLKFVFGIFFPFFPT